MNSNLLNNWSIQQGTYPSLYFQGSLKEAKEVEDILLSCFGDHPPIREEASGEFIELFSSESFDTEPWAVTFFCFELSKGLTFYCLDRKYLCDLALGYTAKRDSLLAFVGKTTRHRFLISGGEITKDWSEVPFTGVNPSTWI